MGKRRQRRLKAKNKVEETRYDKVTGKLKPRPVSKHAVSQKKEVSKPVRTKRPEGILGFFDKNYKVLMIIPFIILFLAIAQIGIQYSTTGDFMNKGVSLKGGVTLTIPSPDIDALMLEEKVKEAYPDIDIAVRTLASASSDSLGLVLEADIIEDAKREAFIVKVSEITGVAESEINVDSMGPSLGESFFKQTFIAMIVAFVLMGLVVLIYFRTMMPSFAVMLCAFSDIIVTLAVVNLLGIKISTAGIAAFLMLIGYSIDTDILLTTRVLKDKTGSVFERIFSAAKTGLTMSFSTIAAVTVGLMVSQSEVLTQIMTIMLIGLLVDLIFTWLQNVGLLRWYVDRKGTK